MEKYSLEPTEENIVSSIKNDATGRNQALYLFLKMLSEQDGPWSVAIDAQWGYGKTFFVKQVQYLIDSINQVDKIEDLAVGNLGTDIKLDTNKIQYNTVYFDAWEHDNDDDPILSLTNEIAQTKWVMTNELFKLAFEVCRVGLKLATNIDIKKISESFNDWKNFEDWKNFQKSKKDRQDGFTEALNKLITKSGKKIIFFIDELDRCKPTYAIKLLERVKHYFGNENITFVVSMNIKELQKTVRKYYGEEYDGEHYLYRFFDIFLELPAPNLKNYYKMLFENKDFSIDRTFYGSYCNYLVSQFNFSLRDLNQFLLLSNSATFSFRRKLSDLCTQSEKFTNAVYIFLLPYMIALRISSIEAYNSFVNGDSMGRLAEYLSGSQIFKKYMVIKDDVAREIVTNLYKGIFEKRDGRDEPFIKISDKFTLEDPKVCYEKLVSACSMISSYVKYD